MENEFKGYLIRKGYKQVTPSGNPSTVYDYVQRIKKVCAWENMTWVELAKKIENIVPLYDNGGINVALGKKSHCAIINALRRFKEFVDSRHAT